MTSLLVIIDNQYCISYNTDSNTGTTIATNIKILPVIINDEQKASTSHDYNGLSAYNRLRHSERQRRRYKQMLQQKQKQLLQMHHSESSSMDDKFFDNFRRPLNIINNNNNNNGVMRNKLKAHHRDLKSKREKNEPLCESDRNTVHMNTPTEEYDPPFFVEIRCKSIADYEQQQGRMPIRRQTCVHGMLRCVQNYKDQHFSRRRIGSHSWHPYTIPNVPSSCECMWPVDKYGHQEL
uniref:Spaetzle domain-containing protein n=1 Tax=Onchocerca volvulus TaxID=6282 RepID=A0A8R1TZU6_ONCVO